jgi:hypothetical protein
MTDGRSDITDMLERMPAFPTSVLELTADINAGPKELVAIIEQKLLVHLHWTPLNTHSVRMKKYSCSNRIDKTQKYKMYSPILSDIKSYG